MKKAINSGSKMRDAIANAPLNSVDKDTTPNPLNLSKAGIVIYDGLGGFSVREIITPGGSGLSIENSDGVKGNPTLTALRATTTSPGIVQLADKEATKQGTVEDLEKLAPFSTPSYWVCFSVNKDKITVLREDKGTEISSISNYYQVFKETSKTSITAPLSCTAWSDIPCYHGWKFTCLFDVEIGTGKFVKGQHGLRVNIFPFINNYPAKNLEIPLTIQINSYESW